MRMGRKIKQNVFSHVRGEIDQLGTRQFLVDGERGTSMSKGNGSRHRTHFNSTGWASVPVTHRAPSEIPEVQRVAERPSADDTFRGELGNRTLFFALEMQAIGLDMPEMDFHDANPSMEGVRQTGRVWVSEKRLQFLEFLRERFRNPGRNKLGHIATEPRDFLHDARAEISVFFFRHQENRLDRGLELAIHQRHLEFKFEIGNSAQPADNGGRFPGDSEIDQQTIERRDLDIVDFPEGALEKVEPFLE